MRLPFVLGTFLSCSVVCAQTATNAPTGVSVDLPDLSRTVRAEVLTGGNKGNPLGVRSSALRKPLRRNHPPGNPRPRSPIEKRPISRRIDLDERIAARVEIKEIIAAQRASLRLNELRISARDEIAAVKERALERRAK